MSLSEDLPLYKDTLGLLTSAIERTKSYPRYYRYTIGENITSIMHIIMMNEEIDIGSTRFLPVSIISQCRQVCSQWRRPRVVTCGREITAVIMYGMMLLK